MLKCYVEGRNIQENSIPKSYNISDGAVFTENYNETLDSGSIIIENIGDEIEIEPYDTIVIDGTNNALSINNRRFLVDTYTRTQISLQPLLYKYEISLFSETKILENYLCPSLSITPLKTGTKRSVLWYIDEYNRLYGPKGNEYLSISNRLHDKFYNVECPEMQWNEPTLREVLNGLMMVRDCIAVVKDGFLDYLDISSVGYEITDYTGINYIQESHSSEDYISELKMNLVNVANNSNLSNISTKIVERIGFRNDESYLLTDQNIVLQTNFPVWNIYKLDLWMKLQINYEYSFLSEGSSIPETRTVSVNTWVPRHLINYISEYKEWQTKNIYYKPMMGLDLDLDINYRNRSLYYIRGNKNIFNWSDYQEFQFLFIKDTQAVWEMAMKYPLDQIEIIAREDLDRIRSEDPNPNNTYTFLNLKPSTPYEIIGDNNQTLTAGTEWRMMEFEVEYETLDDPVFKASKITDILPRHHREVFDNQTNSYINTYTQGMLEYMKANRLGNKLSLINARYMINEEYIPALSEKINGKIIFRKQISVYNNYFNVNYYATENYVLKNYFTGVKSKLRSWRIVSGEEAFIRADILKYYINENIPTYGAKNQFSFIPSHNNLQWYLENFKYCAIIFNVKNGPSLPQNTEYPQIQDQTNPTYPTNGLQVEFSKHIFDKSIIFTIRMKDNYYATNYISNADATGGKEQKGIAYTDGDGEITGGTIYFYNDYFGEDYANSDIVRSLKPLVNIGTMPDSVGSTLIYDDLVAKIPFDIKKDNKEILQISIQFELNEKANDMFLGYKEEENEESI